MTAVSNVDVMVVADVSRQRMALAETVRGLGFDVVGSMSAEQLLSYSRLPKADLWLVDGDFEADKLNELLSKASPSRTLMGFLPAPVDHGTDAYVRWQRALACKLFGVLPSQHRAPKYRKNNQKWQYVVFLGASMGGPDSVKEFLDNLSPELPIAILLAHHFNENMLDSLPRILTRHNDWRCKVVTMTQSLRSGTCLIAPIHKKIVCDSTGKVILTKQSWAQDYRPNIGELLKNTSEVFGSQLISIIFSGMGDDGSQHAKELTMNQSIFWAQDPKSCPSPSQPQAFIDTGVCQFVGTPKELAEKLTQLLRPYVATKLALQQEILP